MVSGESNSLGEFLRQEREKRGISIEQVASATKIGVRLLHSLEADQFAELPAKPFIRGFVTSYARFVGLDPKEILTQFGDFIDKRAQDRPSREAGHSGYAFEKKDTDQSRTFLWVTMGVFMVIGAVAFTVLKPSLKHQHGSHVEKLRAAHGTPQPVALALTDLSGRPPGHDKQPPATSPSTPVTNASSSPLTASASPQAAASLPSPLPAAKPSTEPSKAPSLVATASPVSSPSPSLSPSPSPTPEGKPDPLNSGVNLPLEDVHHKVIVKAIDSVWVRYKVDDRPPKKFVLKKDKLLVLRAKDGIRLQFENPESVLLAHNSRNFKPSINAQGLTTIQKTPTVFFPAKLAASIKDPFPGTTPLSSLPRPKSDVPSPTPSEGPEVIHTQP